MAWKDGDLMVACVGVASPSVSPQDLIELLGCDYPAGRTLVIIKRAFAAFPLARLCQVQLF